MRTSYTRLGPSPISALLLPVTKEGCVPSSLPPFFPQVSLSFCHIVIRQTLFKIRLPLLLKEMYRMVGFQDR